VPQHRHEGTGVRARRSETSQAGLESVAPSPTTYPENRRSNRSHPPASRFRRCDQVMRIERRSRESLVMLTRRRAVSRHHRNVPPGRGGRPPSQTATTRRRSRSPRQMRASPRSGSHLDALEAEIEPIGAERMRSTGASILRACLDRRFPRRKRKPARAGLSHVERTGIEPVTSGLQSHGSRSAARETRVSKAVQPRRFWGQGGLSSS
jgi:hypothetical protein